jgi:uncharacterized protein (TIGR03437 family)
VNGETLTATVPATLIARAGMVQVAVVQPDGPVATLDFTIGPAAKLTIAPGGIVNAASSDRRIAPGSLISIYAYNLPSQTAFAEAAPLPTVLGGVSVLINGIAVPLLFVGPVQINAQVPFEIEPGPAFVKLSVNGVLGEQADLEVGSTGPGILSLPSTNHALAQNADYTLNSAVNPARPGQYVVLYLTGQGLVDPPVATGEAAPSSPLSYPVARVEATIGGRPATVAFAGLAPGLAGVLQVNLLVPPGGAGELPVEVAIGGVASAPAMLSIGAN